MSLPARDDFLGALSSRGETFFRVWAPQARQVEVVFEDGGEPAMPLQHEADGYFSGATSTRTRLYRYRVDGRGPFPDPCSRFQPQGVHGPSLIVDSDAFPWTDQSWRGARIRGQVIYEIHVGAFTPAGTFDAAAEKLEYLRELGVTMIELMPIAECPGRWNWGYDGVQLFAPYHVYGDHDALKRFVDRAHAHGLAVILDVVYNHLGPDGNYLACFSPRYFSERKTDWGDAPNFDGEHCEGMRQLVHRTTRATGCANSTSTVFASMRRSRSSTAAGATSSRSTCRWRERAHARRTSSSFPRTKSSRAGSCCRSSAAASDWTRCGTTISITPPRLP